MDHRLLKWPHGRLRRSLSARRPSLLSQNNSSNNDEIAVHPYDEALAMAIGRHKAPLVLEDSEREAPEQLTRRRDSSQAVALRARIVLGCAEGQTNTEVARELAVGSPLASLISNCAHHQVPTARLGSYQNSILPHFFLSLLLPYC
jgi:hypothetical protein